MKYTETAPSPRLARFVKCFWALEQDRTTIPSTAEPVIPDGSLEIIFNLADPFRRYHPDGSIEHQPRAIIAGQMRSSALIEPSGDVRLFGIRFHHAGAYPFFRFPLNELTGNIVALEQVWGGAARTLEGRLHDTNDMNERVAIAEATLGGFLTNLTEVDDLAEHATRLIVHSRGQMPIEQIARQANQSTRRLERRFQQRLGISPKFFSRTIRFQHLLSTIRQEGTSDLLGTALAAGYYDQSHLIREFKQFSGTTPVEFFARERQLSAVFLAP